MMALTRIFQTLLAIVAVAGCRGDDNQANDAGRSLFASVFTDHMVLQADAPIAVWGRAAPESILTVSLGDQERSASADEKGYWRASFDALPAGESFELTAATKDGDTQKLTDLVAGDVWFCSGQSNMEFSVNAAEGGKAAIRWANDPMIRLLKIKRIAGASPKSHFYDNPQWSRASPQSTKDFSAVCYFTALELRKTVDRPLGLVSSSFGGAGIEAWISADGLAATGDFDDGLSMLETYSQDKQAAYALFGEKFANWWAAQMPQTPTPWKLADNDGWKEAPRGLGDWNRYGDPDTAALAGNVWYRTTFKVSEEQAGKPATLALGPVDERDVVWINDRVVGVSFGWATNRYYPLPEDALKPGDNVITVNVYSGWDQGGLLGPRKDIKIDFDDGDTISLAKDWVYRAAPRDIAGIPFAPWEPITGLTGLYNAMAAPMRGLKMTGVIWYQGETNAAQPEAYGALLSTFFADWRDKFGDNLSFVVVQLPNFGPATDQPAQSNWAKLRDEQRRAVLADVNAALVVTIDSGDPLDIHPVNKKPVAERAAFAIRGLVYGDTAAPASPTALEALREDDSIVIRFSHVQGELRSNDGEAIKTFELCDEQACQFAAATAMQDRVMLQVPPQFAPTKVRYAWADNPTVNLVDASNLPATPFEMRID
jgi:sialate O-acetylesterase